MNLSPKTLLFLNVALLFFFSYRFFTKIFIFFKTNEYSILSLSITAAALVFTIFQIVKYSKIVNGSDDK